MIASNRPQTSWQPMTSDDLDAVIAIAEAVHPDFPEDRDVLAERLALHPRGCFVLRDEMDAAIIGYVLSHPWSAENVPPLNQLIGRLPNPEIYYIHDIALLIEARGLQGGERAVALVEAEAKALGMDRIALVAVNNSSAFWLRQGFSPEQEAKWSIKLASYGTDAAYMVKSIKRLQEAQ